MFRIDSERVVDATMCGQCFNYIFTSLKFTIKQELEVKKSQFMNLLGNL